MYFPSAIACAAATAGVVILLVLLGILGVFIRRRRRRRQSKLTISISPEIKEPEYAVITSNSVEAKPTDTMYKMNVNTLEAKDSYYEEIGDGIKSKKNDAYGCYIGTKSHS